MVVESFMFYIRYTKVDSVGWRVGERSMIVLCEDRWLGKEPLK